MEDSIFDPTPEPVDLRRNERFHLLPAERLEFVATLGGIVGAVTGFYDGIKTSSLRYLTENGHRLPRTVGGWYFYHKKKNYIMIIHGFRRGLVHGIKYSLGVTTFFGIELLLDEAKTHIDFTNTGAAGLLLGGLYGGWNRLSRVQTIGYMRRGAVMGLCVGIAQDIMINARGGRIWYVDWWRNYQGVPRPQSKLQA